MANFQVVVGNVGKVYDGSNKSEANTLYNRYVRSSKAGRGRAAGESVTLFMDGEPKAEHHGTIRDAVLLPPVAQLAEGWKGDRLTYRVAVVDVAGSDSRTVYEGASFLQSQKIVDAVRTALVIGGGSADIEQRVNEKRGPIIRVTQGAWTVIGVR